MISHLCLRETGISCAKHVPSSDVTLYVRSYKRKFNIRLAHTPSICGNVTVHSRDDHLVWFPLRETARGGGGQFSHPHGNLSMSGYLWTAERPINELAPRQQQLGYGAHSRVHTQGGHLDSTEIPYLGTSQIFSTNQSRSQPCGGERSFFPWSRPFTVKWTLSCLINILLRNTRRTNWI